jgi:hypothetical protein
MGIDTGPFPPGAELGSLPRLAVYLDPVRGAWTCQLLHLMRVADRDQRARLEVAYPREFRALWLWQQARPGVTALELGTLLEIFPPETERPGPVEVLENWPPEVDA